MIELRTPAEIDEMRPAGRFVAPNVSLALTGEQAVVDWFGETLECTLR